MRRLLTALLLSLPVAATAANTRTMGTTLTDSAGVGSVLDIVRELERKMLEHEHRGNDGSSEVVPVGAYIPYGGATAPEGWLLCDGTAYSTATYARLFDVIGYSYGGGGGTFNVPDLRGRAPIGAGTGTGLSTFTVGQSTGTETISVAQMPVHSHGVTDPGHYHTRDTTSNIQTGGAETLMNATAGGAQTSSNTTGISINNTGGGNTFRSPSLAGNFIIYAGE